MPLERWSVHTPGSLKEVFGLFEKALADGAFLAAAEFALGMAFQNRRHWKPLGRRLQPRTLPQAFGDSTASLESQSLVTFLDRRP